MSQMSLDYARVERALRYLDSIAPQQPALREVAATVGLSEFHFQRLFSRWAGISPKQFLRVQTLEFAKDRLAQSRNVLEAAWDSGLSGGGRMHDLFVNVDAVTPGEYQSGGAGVEIDAGFHATPFGEALIGVTERGICGLSFVTDSRDAALNDLRRRWPAARVIISAERTRPVIDQVFGGWRRDGGLSALAPLRVLVKGTNFQTKVWQALLSIPPGHLASYEDVARVVCSREAARAVGAAVAANPVAYLIPCHRVIRSTGALGGYHWGVERKRAILAWESGRVA
ncbi:MAG TPA: methylated-DNA--[protein]-cysteine S-methyltransferase [Gemmatimonadaceae bacterium]|nr:methylated-DNA--[protein]-cysteine S-methyltransferase [Gemmatimonadaceae bacterium]